MNHEHSTTTLAHMPPSKVNSFGKRVLRWCLGFLTVLLIALLIAAGTYVPAKALAEIELMENYQ